MIDRDAAWCLLTEFTQSESLRKHALAVEACMRAYARKFGGDGQRDGSALEGDEREGHRDSVEGHEHEGHLGLDGVERHEREGHDFSRAAKPQLGQGASAPEGMTEEDLWGIVGLIHDFDYD